MDISFNRIPITHPAQLFDGIHRRVNSRHMNSVTHSAPDVKMLGVAQSLSVCQFLAVLAEEPTLDSIGKLITRGDMSINTF